jgi:hypothetical protein
MEVRMTIIDQRPDDIDPALLEAVELELSLQSAMPFEDGCEAALREALAKTGGALLFHMRPDADEPDQSISAVFFGSGDDINIGLVTVSEKDRTVSVEAVEKSRSPLARIAPAYAAVLAHLHAAA